MATLTTGRNTRVVKYARGKNSLAPMKTILNAVADGNYNINRKIFRITNNDMLGWKRREFESLTLILLVDISKSTKPFIKVFQEILTSLTGYFNKFNDRVGLISLQGMQSQIYSHPTHNFRVVARGLTRLTFHGETPIADGLVKSLSMARLERSKNPGSRSIVILLSDCYPEPLTPGSRNVLDDPAYRNSINAASLYRKARVMLLVINPAFTTEEGKLPGEILAQDLVKVSRGKLIKLCRGKDRMHTTPTQKEIQIILKGVEDSFTAKKVI
jgi:Mg-chelatase subunit ChlD